MDSGGIKTAAILIIGGGLFLGGFYLPKHFEAKGYERGREEVLAENRKANLQAKLDRYGEIINDLKANEAIQRKVIKDYEQKIKNDQTKYAADVAAIRAAGGLRFKQTAVCASDRSARTTEAESTAATDGARVERLPEHVEEGLFAIAGKCQALQTKLTSLQQWIKDSGLE